MLPWLSVVVVVFQLTVLPEVSVTDPLCEITLPLASVVVTLVQVLPWESVQLEAEIEPPSGVVTLKPLGVRVPVYPPLICPGTRMLLVFPEQI